MKTNENKILKWVIAVIAVILLLLSYSLYSYMTYNSDLRNLLTSKDSEIKTYRLKNGELVLSKAELDIALKDLTSVVFDKNASLREMSNKFSKVSKVVTAKINISIPKATVIFDKPIDVSEIDSTGQLNFNRKGAYFSKWFEFGYSLNKDSLSLEPININTELNIIHGSKRKWFLGRETKTTDISFTNPYINTDEVKIYSVKVKVPIYNTRVFNFGLGLVSGLMIK